MSRPSQNPAIPRPNPKGEINMSVAALPARKPGLRWARTFFFVFGAAALAWVAFSIIDARIFELREERQFRDMGKHAASPFKPEASLMADEVVRLPIAPGAVLGRIAIRRIGVDAIIVDGAGSKSLRPARRHIAGTAFPGEQGN